MSQIGAPVRIVALIGVLAALGVGAWSFTAGQSASSSPAEASAAVAPPSVAANPVAAAKAVAGKLSAHNKATAAGRAPAAPAKAPAAQRLAASTAAPAAKAPAPAPAKAAAPKEAAPNETPTTIASLLKQYPAVVVLLYDPQSQVDAYSVTEAALGAQNAKAGFLRVDVMNQRQTAPFTQAYGVLQDPTVLFFSRPGKLVQKLSGFADHETVAQAALNAALGLGTSQTTTPATS